MRKSAQAEIRNRKKEIGEFGAGRPDFGGRRPRGEALGKKKVLGVGNADIKCDPETVTGDRAARTTFGPTK